MKKVTKSKIIDIGVGAAGGALALSLMTGALTSDRPDRPDVKTTGLIGAAVGAGAAWWLSSWKRILD